MRTPPRTLLVVSQADRHRRRVAQQQHPILARLVAQQLSVTRLLEALEGDCLAHQWIGDHLGVSVDDRARSPFGIEDFLPKRDGAQAAER